MRSSDVGLGRLKVLLAEPLVVTDAGTVFEALVRLLPLKMMVEFHWAKSVMFPVVVYGLSHAAKFVPDPSAAVFHPANVYPVRASVDAVSKKVVRTQRVAADGTVAVSLVLPFPS